VTEQGRPKTLLEGFGEATEQVVALRTERDRLRHDLSWQYGEVARLRTVMTRAVNLMTGPRWPGDDDPYIAVIRLLQDALKPNSTVGKE
jgi:hypothetical protein